MAKKRVWDTDFVSLDEARNVPSDALQCPCPSDSSHCDACKLFPKFAAPEDEKEPDDESPFEGGAPVYADSAISASKSADRAFLAESAPLGRGKRASLAFDGRRIC